VVGLHTKYVRYWLLREFDPGNYVVLDELGYAYEFDTDAIKLLTLWVDIIGCMQRPFEISVLCKVGGMVCDWCTGVHTRYLDVSEIQSRIASGFLIMDKLSLFKYCNPAIAMRFGVNAIVTDGGKLVYFYNNGRTVVNLNDFCTYVCNNSLHVNGACTFCIDSRMADMEDRFYMSVLSKPKLIARGPLDKMLRAKLLKLQLKGVITIENVG